MPTTYMMLWSIVIILLVGFWRVRDAGRVLLVTAITTIILVCASALFSQLSLAAGINPAGPVDMSIYLTSGPMAWLALLVMPCGWLGPVIGLHFVQKGVTWQQPQFSG